MPATNLAASQAQPASTAPTEQESSKKWYDIAPVELVAETWKHALEAKGVHRFQIEALTFFSGEAQITQLRVREYPSQDASTWRHRHNISQVDQIAEHEFKKWVRKTTKEHAMWIAPIYRKVPRKNERIYNTMAKVHGKNDLVILSFDKSAAGLDVELEDIDKKAIRSQFRGVSRIAIHCGQTAEKNSPASCFCPAKVHARLPYCPDALASLIRLFVPVYHFYFILRISGKNIKTIETENRAPGDVNLSTKVFPASKRQKNQVSSKRIRVCKTKPEKSSAKELVNDTFRDFRALAKKKKLEIWSDSKQEYCEIELESLDKLKDFDGVKELLNATIPLYQAKDDFQWSDRGKQLFAKTKFHILVTRGQTQRKAVVPQPQLNQPEEA